MIVPTYNAGQSQVSSQIIEDVEEDTHAKIGPLVEKAQAAAQRATNEAHIDAGRIKKEMESWTNSAKNEHEKMRGYLRGELAASRMDVFDKGEVLRQVRELKARVEELEKGQRGAGKAARSWKGSEG